MAQGFSLQLILDLAVRAAEGQAREVKRCHGEWLRARGRQVQLLALRDQSVNELAARLRPGLTTAALQQRTRFMRLQQRELEQATAHIAATHAAWQSLLSGWMRAQARVKALRVLEARHFAARAVQQRREAQRQHDELAQNTRFWRTDNEGTR